jgi:hypothetical protein
MSRSTPSDRRRRIRNLGIPDTSTTIHTWADGWTIRRLTTAEDMRREGRLVHTCLATAVDEPFDLGPDNDLILGPDHKLVNSHLHSLRDPDNYPRATFFYCPTDRTIGELVGHSDQPIQPTYHERLREWHPPLPNARDAHAAHSECSCQAALKAELRILGSDPIATLENLVILERQHPHATVVLRFTPASPARRINMHAHA